MQRDIGKYVKRVSLSHSSVSLGKPDDNTDGTPQTGLIRRDRPEACHTGILGMLGARTNEAMPLVRTERNNGYSGGNLFIKRPHNSSVSSRVGAELINVTWMLAAC